MAGAGLKHRVLSSCGAAAFTGGRGVHGAGVGGPQRDFGVTSHTVLLVQPANGPEGRTYADCESVNERVEGVWKMYEEPRKGMNPNSPSVADDVGRSLV